MDTFGVHSFRGVKKSDTLQLESHARFYRESCDKKNVMAEINSHKDVFIARENKDREVIAKQVLEQRRQVLEQRRQVLEQRCNDFHIPALTRLFGLCVFA